MTDLKDPPSFALDQLARDMGVTEDEFLILWQKRYMLGDGRVRPGLHFASFVNALTIIREGHADRLAKCLVGRKD